MRMEFGNGTTRPPSRTGHDLRIVAPGLDPPDVNNADETWGILIAGLLFHGSYHAGQIGVLTDHREERKATSADLLLASLEPLEVSLRAYEPHPPCCLSVVWQRVDVIDQRLKPVPVDVVGHNLVRIDLEHSCRARPDIDFGIFAG